MSATATPYGLLPIRKIGSASNSTGLTPYKIASGYATSIFYGDVVKLVAGGGIEKDTGTTTATPLGVFMGCQYTDSTMGFITRQYWPASTVAADAVALVCDDPDMVFKVQAGTSVAAADVGLNAALVQTAGSTATGKSAVNIGSLATTGTLPVRIVAIDTNPDNAAGDAYTDVHVIWNTHWLRNRDTGI
jgi:hypothetical protein